MNATQAREKLAQDVFGLITCLMTVPDPLVVKLLDLVPERGEALWLRFTAWRDAQPDEGGQEPFKKFVGTIAMKSIGGF